LKEKLVENERQKREVQADLENQMENTQKLIARITQEVKYLFSLRYIKDTHCVSE
jgi:protein subunit release factor B